MKILLILLLAAPAFAGPRYTTKSYDASCARVWEAAKIAVRGHYDVMNLNDQERSGSFTTGNAWSGVRPLAFNLNGSGEQCTVQVSGHFSGLVHNDKGDFFNRIKEALPGIPAQVPPSATTAPAPAVAPAPAAKPKETAVVIPPRQPDPNSLGEVARRYRQQKAAEQPAPK